MENWTEKAVFYHIYPLGLCAPPERNDFQGQPVTRLDELYPWLDHLQDLGVTALYLGPLFESTAHGYDTADYFKVDRRLGSNQDLKDFSRALHARGLKLVLDGVFNHVGRDFWAFKEVLRDGPASLYTGWFANLNFERRSPYGDSFNYEGWAGNYDLVKLNLANPDVIKHLLEAVNYWMDEFEIDGLRLDAADVLDPAFMRTLAGFCKSKRPDFWLMGEVVHGDYNNWVNPATLDSATNYECDKGLWSSHANQNYFEIAYSLNRQFGINGIYENLRLFNFADNHDVNRVASDLSDQANLYPLYALLFTMPGLPSLYYGSEWGLSGKRTATSDKMLRPALDLAQLKTSSPQPGLPEVIATLARLRRQNKALQGGQYRQLAVKNQQFAFARSHPEETIVVAVNSDTKPASLNLDLGQAGIEGRELVDLLNDGEVFHVQNGKVKLDPLWPNWARILLVR